MVTCNHCHFLVFLFLKILSRGVGVYDFSLFVVKIVKDQFSLGFGPIITTPNHPWPIITFKLFP